MTFTELLHKLHKNKSLPLRVISSRSISHDKYSCPKEGIVSLEGIITYIRIDGKRNGCAVRFDGLNYEKWFHAKSGTDMRSTYLKDLIFI